MRIQTVEISNSAESGYIKTYASRKALDKGTAEIEALIAEYGTARKLIVAAPEGSKAGRQTAIFILSEETRFLSIHVAQEGFQVIA